MSDSITVTRPIEIKDKWAIYRQTLRDVPAQEGAPITVVWPEKPI